jgi:hypothetical protein
MQAPCNRRPRRAAAILEARQSIEDLRIPIWRASGRQCRTRFGLTAVRVYLELKAWKSYSNYKVPVPTTKSISQFKTPLEIDQPLLNGAFKGISGRHFLPQTLASGS